MEARIRHVDGLRAVAVLSVVMYHAWRSEPRDSVWQIHLFNAAAHGVDLFFVISGFCLSYPYLENFRNGKKIDFQFLTFLTKRFFRIVPPYYAAIGLFSAFALLGLYPGVSTQDLIKQALFVDWRTRFVNISFWSLVVEWHWYFWFPIALWIYTRKSYGLIVVCLFSYMVFCVLDNSVVDLETAMSFCMGMYAADVYICSSRASRFSLAVFIPALIIGLYEVPDVVGNYPSPPLQIASCAFVIMSGRNIRLQRLLSWEPAVWIGRRSYSIYLVHYPIIEMSVRYAHAPWLLAGFLGTVGGVIFWYLVERVTMQRGVWHSPPLKGQGRFLGGSAG